MFRVVAAIAVLGGCVGFSAAVAQPVRKPPPEPKAVAKPAPLGLPVYPEAGKPAPAVPPLDRFPGRKVAPGGAEATPAPAPAPLPRPDARGELYIPNLKLWARENDRGVVEVTRAAANPVTVLVARDRGLSPEVFVPGDTIYGFGGKAVGSVEELYELSLLPGWHYVEGICNGANTGKAYIGRVHIPK